ncbi:MAG: hypothetical protein Q8P33_02025 [bacterium]|nr:hypothetical protein [bacterium]
MTLPRQKARFVGLKELRQNMAKITSSALKKRERLIVLKKNKPIFELRPLSEKEAALEQILIAVREGEQDVRAGRTYSLEEAAKNLELD